LILSFKDKVIRECCENQKVAVETYGDIVSDSLIKRLSDLESAENIYDILLGNPTAVDDLCQSYQIEIENNFKIFFSQNHPDLPKNEKVDWENIYRIIIIKISNTNV
jgi:hypothetical protein